MSNASNSTPTPNDAAARSNTQARAKRTPDQTAGQEPVDLASALDEYDQALREREDALRAEADREYNDVADQLVDEDVAAGDDSNNQPMRHVSKGVAATAAEQVTLIHGRKEEYYGVGVTVTDPRMFMPAGLQRTLATLDNLEVMLSYVVAEADNLPEHRIRPASLNGVDFKHFPLAFAADAAVWRKLAVDLHRTIMQEVDADLFLEVAQRYDEIVRTTIIELQLGIDRAGYTKFSHDATVAIDADLARSIKDSAYAEVVFAFDLGTARLSDMMHRIYIAIDKWVVDAQCGATSQVTFDAAGEIARVVDATIMAAE